MQVSCAFLFRSNSECVLDNPFIDENAGSQKADNTIPSAYLKILIAENAGSQKADNTIPNAYLKIHFLKLCCTFREALFRRALRKGDSQCIS